MIQTSRISSGFDIEFQLGRGWFITALNGLAERGLLITPGSIPFISPDATFEVTDVEIIFNQPGWDLSIDLLIGGILPVTIQASLSLNAAGTELILQDSLTGTPTNVPFGALSGLAGAPELIKLEGDANHEPVMAILANMDIRASAQNVDPLPAGEHLARGDSANARSFLPLDKDMSLGIASGTLQRFANDIWHSQLADGDGNHPFPDAANRQGDWRSVSMGISNGRIRATLRAVAEVDTPLIDIIPDPDITVTVDLIPAIVDGRLTFDIEVDTDIDFGILGDLLAGLIGGLIGFVIGLFTGNPIGGAIIGAGIGIVTLEIGEVIAGNVIAREIQAQIDGTPLRQYFSCVNNVMYLATLQDQGQGLNLGFLDALPTSIPIYSDKPDPLHERFVLVSNSFDEITMDNGGFGLEGLSVIDELYTPVDATITGKVMNSGELAGLIYTTTDNTDHELTLDEVLGRASSDDVPEPLSVMDSASNEVITQKQNGQIPIACMHPVAIHREATIITEIRFDTGVELDTLDTIRLQDSGALILPNLQLIHPSNGRPYYRAPADDSIANNFESLPEY